MDTQQQGIDLQALKEAAQQAVESGADLQQKISSLMVSGFSSGHLDLSRIREVTRAVLDGVATAVDHKGTIPPGAIKQSIAGVEDALLQAAEASRLAVQEAAGRVAGFTRQDLGKAVDDLGSIEALFMETLGEVARSGTETASAIFGDLLQHLKYSGTDLGARLQEISHGLGIDKLPAADGNGLQAGAEAMQKAARQLAEIAGEILAGAGNGLSKAAAGTADRKPDGKGDD